MAAKPNGIAIGAAKRVTPFNGSLAEFYRGSVRLSLKGYACPYCAARGHYSELEYRFENGDNLCPACCEVLIAE